MFLLCSQKLYTYTASRQKCQNDPKSVPPGCKRSMMFPPTFGHLFFQNMAPPFCTNSVFCNSFPQIIQKKQLFLCCMSVGLCQSAAKGKRKGGRNSNRLMKVTKIGFLGVRIFFLVSWLLLPVLNAVFVIHQIIRYIVSAKTNMNTKQKQ